MRGLPAFILCIPAVVTAVFLTFIASVNAHSDTCEENKFQRSLEKNSCDYYASPDGKGNGLSMNSPFLVSGFWSYARPGKTLCLLDGEYTGSQSMIAPPPRIGGRFSQPVTVKAYNDGKVLINGQGKHIPIELKFNDFFSIKGVNACNSRSSVVVLYNSRHNIMRRICAWDAQDGNTEIFGAHAGSEYNLFEDCAGWGIARKIFQFSYGGNYTTLRRCWGRWEGSHVVGPKMTYTIAYENHNMLIENCIGTWSGQSMKQEYTLGDYKGGYWTGAPPGSLPRQRFTHYSVQDPRAVFSNDGMTSHVANSKMLGCLAYVLPTDVYPPSCLFHNVFIDNLVYRDLIGVVKPKRENVKNIFKEKFSENLNMLCTNISFNVTEIANYYFNTEIKKSRN